MDQRIIVRYSMSFKQQVVEELESGRFSSKSDARRAVREAVMLYNYRRPHQELGYRCPMEVQAKDQ